MKRVIVVIGLLVSMNCKNNGESDLPPTATYTVTFNATWSNATHPNQFPSRAHFSKLVVVSHNKNVEFWKLGELSSLGVQNIAELGANSEFNSEFEQAKTLNNADVYIESIELSNLPDSTTISFTVNEDHPFLTALSMIAPSPDWFVGVNNVHLIEDEEWVDELTITLLALDAGTDSGDDFRSADEVTNPKQPIHYLDFGSSSLNTFGELTITRVD